MNHLRQQQQERNMHALYTLKSRANPTNSFVKSNVSVEATSYYENQSPIKLPQLKRNHFSLLSLKDSCDGDDEFFSQQRLVPAKTLQIKNRKRTSVIGRRGTLFQPSS